MSWLLIGVYCGILWLVFDRFRLIRLSLPVAIVAAAVGPGAVLVLLFGAQYFHPYTVSARALQQVIPLVPQLTQQGRVFQIAGEPNTRFKKGDLLIRVDPLPYQLTVARLQAELAEAEQGEQVAEADVELAQAELERSNGELEFATKERDRKATLLETDVVSQADYDAAVDIYVRANAAVKKAIAGLLQARLSVNSAKERIAQKKSQLAIAEYDLEQTNVVAPGDGYVTNLRIQLGTLVGGANNSPVMDFALDPHEATHGILVASFGQKNFLKIKKGQYAEVALNGYPGRIFKARVLSKIDVSGAGQLTERGIVPTELLESEPTSFAVRVRLDDRDGLRLPPGSQGQVAIYTEEMQISGIVVMFIIRTQSWLHFVL